MLDSKQLSNLLETKGRQIERWFNFLVRFQFGDKHLRTDHLRMRPPEAVWAQIAAFAARKQININSVVGTVLNRSNGRNPPTPTVFLRNGVLDGACEQQATRRSEMKSSLRSNANRADMYHSCYIRRGATNLEAWQQVVYSSQTDLSGLYRYCLACRAGFDDLAENYELPAILEYAWEQAAYDTIWEDWVPEKLRDVSREMLQLLNQAPPTEHTALAAQATSLLEPTGQA